MITRTVLQLAEISGATLEGDGGRRITGPASLRDATAEHVSFLGNPLYSQDLENTAAAAVVVPMDLEPARDDLTLLRSDHPNRAFSRVIEVFRPALDRPPPGRHETALIAPDATLGENVSIGPYTIVGPGAVIEDDACLVAKVFVGARSRVGARSLLYAGVVIQPEVEVGADCVIHSGAVVGSDGFGFDPGSQGWEKVPHCGTVVVEDDVEIGANTTIDRARFGATRIRRGAKLDNLVHVAHNVDIGSEALLIAQVGIAGSSKIGDRVILAGQAGVTGHVTIGDGARLAAQAGVTKDLPGGKDYLGAPAREKGDAVRIFAALPKLPELARRVRELERRLDRLEE